MRLILACGVVLAAAAPCGQLIRLFRVRPATSRSKPSPRPGRIPGRCIPARRPHAGDRAARPHAHRRPRRRAVAAAQRRARSCARAARPACSMSRSIVTSRNNRTIYFCFQRSTVAATHAVARARARCRRRRRSTTSRSSSVSRARRRQQQSRLPHRAGARQQSVRHARRPFRARGMKRRISRSTSARSSASGQTAKCRKTILSSAKPAHGRRSGLMAIAIRKASPSIRPTANCGSRSTGRRAATRSISSTRAKTTAGRWSATASITAAPKFTTSTHKAGMEHPVWHWTPSIAPSGMAVLYRRSVPELERQPVQRRA